MPSLAAHMVCAKLVSNNLSIDSDDFIRGNILPDIINEKNSHKIIMGKYYEIPDIKYFINKLDLDNKMQLGYLTHLLLDKYYLDNYIHDIALDDLIFNNGIIYKEYDIINKELLKKFEINPDKIKDILSTFDVPLRDYEYKKNLDYLYKGGNLKELKYLDLNNFSNFLENISKIISNDIKEVISNENKISMSNVSVRK